LLMQCRHWKGWHWRKSWCSTDVSKFKHFDLIFTSVKSFNELVTVLFSHNKWGFWEHCFNDCTVRSSCWQWRSVNSGSHCTWWTMMNQSELKQYVCVSQRHTWLRLKKAEQRRKQHC
jgi:hypothetical protein